MKLGLLVSFSRRLPLELGTFSKIPTAHTRYFQGAVIPPPGDLHAKIVSPMCGKKSWIKGQYLEQGVDPRLPRLG